MTSRTTGRAVAPGTLRRAWETDRDKGARRARHEPWCRGHGWMLDAGLAEILDPLVYGGDFGDTTIDHYASLDAGVARSLLEPLGEDYLRTERQNDGPSIGSVLHAVIANPDTVRAHGYVVGPSRCDERVTVEGVLFRMDRDYRLCSLYEGRRADCECELLFEWLRAGLDLDAHRTPHELTAWYGRVGEPNDGAGGHWYRAWWT